MLHARYVGAVVNEAPRAVVIAFLGFHDCPRHLHAREYLHEQELRASDERLRSELESRETRIAALERDLQASGEKASSDFMRLTTATEDLQTQLRDATARYDAEKQRALGLAKSLAEVETRIESSFQEKLSAAEHSSRESMEQLLEATEARDTLTTEVSSNQDDHETPSAILCMLGREPTLMGGRLLWRARCVFSLSARRKK